MRVVVLVAAIALVAACKKSEVTMPAESSSAPPPSPSSSPSAGVWRGLRWDMAREIASKTLAGQGLKVSERGPTKDPTSWISADVDGTNATVYFDEKDRMNQITIIWEKTSKEGAASAKERLSKRFGAVRGETTRIEHRWSSGKGPWTDLLVLHEPNGWRVHEEYGRVDGTGAVGFLDLVWGQAVPEVEQRLRAAGYEARTGSMDIDPCKMPNPPPSCEPDASVVVRFSKGNEQGHADVNKKRGLVQIMWTATNASGDDAIARRKRIEALRGPPEMTEESTTTKWGDATADVTLDVRQKKPAGTFSMFENYRPPGTKE